MNKAFKAVLIVILLLIPLTFYGCISREGFSIYLTRDNIPVTEMPMLSHYELADKPVISVDDIISYTGDTHEIELTADAYERVTTLKVTTSGRAFVVCVDKKQIYWGAFWTPISSQSFNGVTIWVYPFSQQGNIIKLEPGYPSPGFFQGEDPRSNPEIFQSLEKAGKLR